MQWIVRRNIVSSWAVGRHCLEIWCVEFDRHCRLFLTERQTVTNVVSSLPLAYADVILAQTAASTSQTNWVLPAVALLIGAGLMYAINMLQGRDAKTQSKRLLDQAKLDGENLMKTAELEKKEKLLQLQSKFDSENQKVKEELRKREQGVERKEESLKQTADDVRKQEKLVETTQRKLAERIEDVNRKNEQYTRLIQQQQADLQRVTGMSTEEAKKQLMGILEKELQGELGTVILKHEKKVNEIVQQKTTRHFACCHATICFGANLRKQHEHGRHPQ